MCLVAAQAAAETEIYRLTEEVAGCNRTLQAVSDFLVSCFNQASVQVRRTQLQAVGLLKHLNSATIVNSFATKASLHLALSNRAVQVL